MSSPSRPKGGSPSKPTSSNPAAATFSPRRPATQRSTGGEGHAGSRLATSLALAATDMTAAAASALSPPGTAKSGGHDPRGGTASESGNPHVRAIQSRVAELVRQYDESMDTGRGDDDDDDDDDNRRLDVPTHWRVGDLLLATHSSLAKTSTRTERSMMAEFTEDPDVSMAIGEGERSFSLVLEQAAEKTEQMIAVLAKTLHVVKQLQLSDELDTTNASKDAAGSQQKLRELRIMVEALHKEKSMVLAQHNEHVKSHKEMVAVMEDQSQELRKAQIAIACKQDELKMARDDFAFRLNDLQKMNETSQQTVGMWRDKYQTTLKTLGDTEQRVTELEQRVHAETEEVMKHDFILRAKNSELEKYKEKLKESETARFRAETAEREATAAAAESAAEAATANKKAEAASKTKPNGSDAPAKALAAKERQELEAKIRQHEATIRDLQRRLTEQTDSRSKFEDDNNELARIVRELQAKAQEALNARPPVMTPVVAAPSPPPRIPSVRRTSFTLSLHTIPKHKNRRASTGATETRRGQSSPRDDLSTDSDDAEDVGDPEAERDDRELNDAVHEVVSSVFSARVSPMEDQSDEALDQSIAEFEKDPTSSPLCPLIEDDATTTRRLTATMSVDQRPPSRSLSSSAGTGTTSDVNDTATSELGRLQLAHTEQIERLKKQYVAGLLEYKKLIIEQYERRQNEIQQHHRMEIENLILVVQDKFKNELERRGERVMQAKESLKVLYRAMQGNGPSAGSGGDTYRSGLSSFAEDGEADGVDDEPVDEPMPLKSILRAAVFAMSSSKNRNTQANDAIKRLVDDARTKKTTPRARMVKVVEKQEIERAPEVVPASEPETKSDTDWAVFLQNMRANRDASTRFESAAKAPGIPTVHVACQVDDRDFVIFDLKGLRGSHVRPENVDDYVLPSLALLTKNSNDNNGAPPTTVPRRAHSQRKGGSLDGVLYLNEGALLSDDVVAELRAVLPFLPPGSYFLSPALRHQLLLEMLRFYAELGKRATGRQQAFVSAPSAPLTPREETVEIVVGSPRDTPFLRRKAVESIERRQRLSNGGLAMLSTSTSIAPLRRTGFVSAAMATFPLSHVRQGQGPS